MDISTINELLSAIEEKYGYLIYLEVEDNEVVITFDRSTILSDVGEDVQQYLGVSSGIEKEHDGDNSHGYIKIK